jgi:glyoxylase-like metal-dependent hydrolase (beta-lactamase superfamily II)
MKRSLCLLAISAVALFSLPASGQAPEVTLTRIDCGTGAKPTMVNERFSDTFAFPNLSLTFTFSCYLIKHGDDYMVWDTGFAPGANPNAPKTSLADYLAQVKVKPEQVKYVGISHFHGDHTGQLAPFKNATLLIGKGDWDGIVSQPPVQGANIAGFREWIAEGRKVEPLSNDKDVFGDGSVLILRTPGHTPGHQVLLVRLKEKGPVLLSGDLFHFRENYESGGQPWFNHDRAQTSASIDRFKGLAKNLKATVIIQHDRRDIDKLPAFPAAAR